MERACEESGLGVITSVLKYDQSIAGQASWTGPVAFLFACGILRHPAYHPTAKTFESRCAFSGLSIARAL